MEQSEQTDASAAGIDLEGMILETTEERGDVYGYRAFKIETVRRHDDRENETIIRVLHHRQLPEFFVEHLGENERVLDIRPFSEHRTAGEGPEE